MLEEQYPLRFHLTMILFFCLPFGSHAQIEIMDQFDLGSYSVGFRHEVITDFSRAYGEGFRPVQLYLWYPSAETIKTPIKYTDYLILDDLKGQPGELYPASNDKRLDLLVQKEIEEFKDLKKNKVLSSKYKSLKSIAQEDISVADKSFPLILFAPGGNTSGHFHSVMCEYLASYGFIVISTSSLGTSDTLGWPFDQTGLDLQIDDMAFALNHVQRTMDQADIETVCLISWSVGGVSQGIFCLKNPSIDMLISLDSGLGRTYGIEMLRESPYFDYSKFKIPYLHMTGKQPEIYNVERSSEFYDSIPSQVKQSIVIEHFAHQHFAAQLGIIPALASENEDEIIIKSYVRMCRLSLAFINAHLIY